MPQVSPLMWLSLYVYVMVLLMVFLMIIYYFYFTNVEMMMSNYVIKLSIYKFKW